MTKKLLKISIIVLPLSLLFFFGCAWQKTITPPVDTITPTTSVGLNLDTTTWKTFADDEFGFSFMYPESVAIDGNFGNGSFNLEIAEPPSEEGATDGFLYFTVTGAKAVRTSNIDSAVKKYLALGDYEYLFSYEYAGGNDMKYSDFFNEFIENFKAFPVNGQTVDANNWKSFESDYYGFSFRYPAEWKLYFQKSDNARTTSFPSSSEQFETAILDDGTNIVYIWPLGVPGNAWQDFVSMKRDLTVDGKKFTYYLSSDNIYYFTAVEYKNDYTGKWDFAISAKNASDQTLKKLISGIVRTVKFK